MHPLLLLLRLFRHSPLPAQQVPNRPSTTAASDADRPLGCGWFDSSHDLLSGVIVREGMMVVDNTVILPS